MGTNNRSRTFQDVTWKNLKDAGFPDRILWHKALAAKYPGVLFEQATGTDTSKNLSEYYGAGEDTIYLSGMAAGAAATAVVDFLSPFPVPELIGCALFELSR